MVSPAMAHASCAKRFTIVNTAVYKTTQYIVRYMIIIKLMLCVLESVLMMKAMGKIKEAIVPPDAYLSSITLRNYE